MQTAARTSDADAVAGQLHPSFLVVDASHGIVGPQPPTLRQTNFDERPLHKACVRLILIPGGCQPTRAVCHCLTD